MAKYQDLIAGEDALLAVTGRAWVVGDGITQHDLLDSVQLSSPPHIAAKSLLAQYAPEVARGVQVGDFLVAGLNFAVDAAHRAVPNALRALGLAGVIARSFGQLFQRNAIQCGLPALMVEETGAIRQGDRLRVDIEAHIVANLSSGDRYVIRNIDDKALRVLRAVALTTQQPC